MLDNYEGVDYSGTVASLELNCVLRRDSMGRLYLGAVDSDFDRSHDRLIGPWCLLGTDLTDSQGEHFDFIEPFDTPEAMSRAAFDSARLVSYHIGRLASELNARHGRTYGLPFWWTLLAPWLQHLVEASWRHWILVERFVEIHRDESLLYHAPEHPTGNGWDFTDTRDFIYRGLRSPEFVAWVLSDFLRNLAPAHWDRRIVAAPDTTPRQAYVVRPPESSNALKRISRRLLGRLPVTNLHGISASSLPLSLYVSALPRRVAGDDFRGVAATEIPKDFPKAYLAALDDLIARTIPRSLTADFAARDAEAAARTYHRRRLFVTAPTIFEDHHNLEIAHALQAGERVVRMQHGSEYGTAEVFNVGWMNEYVDAAFLTWGWTAQQGMPGRFIPVPSPALSRLRNRHRHRSSDILLVGTAAILLPFRLMSWQQPSRMFAYRGDKARFVMALDPGVRKHLTYRPYRRGHPELPDESWLMSRVGSLPIHTGDFEASLLSCRLVVLDHPGTTLNIALAANVPTVCYSPFDLIAPCTDAVPYFEGLKSAGILHETPDSAAAHVNAIADDVPGWWSSAETQAARKRWVAKFARTDRVWWWHWLQALARV